MLKPREKCCPSFVSCQFDKRVSRTNLREFNFTSKSIENWACPLTFDFLAIQKLHDFGINIFAKTVTQTIDFSRKSIYGWERGGILKMKWFELQIWRIHHSWLEHFQPTISDSHHHLHNLFRDVTPFQIETYFQILD